MDHRTRGGYRNRLRNGQKQREARQQRRQGHIPGQPAQDTATGITHTGRSPMGARAISVLPPPLLRSNTGASFL